MTISFAATRLAPSPTGALHLGHARTFLITWWLARQAGAKIYMRMDDIDAGRAKPEAVAQAYADLRWLGMDWDDYSTRANAVKEVVQSQRLAVYAEAIERLRIADLIYRCTCRRADILAAVAGSASAPHEGVGGEKVVRYPGTCAAHSHWRDRSVKENLRSAEEAMRKDFCWRLRVPDGMVRFEDLIAGQQEFDVAAETGDFPLTRFDGTPAYQLACVVDDHSMGIDLVIRGDDLLASTPRQILVYQALHLKSVPRFAHVPLVVGADGKRLAKRHGESRIAQFREAGVSAERVVGWVAWRSGQVEKPEEMSAREMVERFDLGRLPRERVVLEREDLGWLG
jgi:glutamyl-tRNA synthetase